MSTAYAELKEQAWRANLDIERLVERTWGNASAADAQAGVMAIKPSGVPYDRLAVDDMVVLSLETGEVVEGRFHPSSDAPTHLALYRAWPDVGAIVHTHSPYAVSWAQAELPIDCLGTTHADHFRGSIPVTRRMREDEIAEEYERNTGLVIVECFEQGGIDPVEMPAVLVACHGPFAWGGNAAEAVENAIVLETVACMAWRTRLLRPEAGPIDDALRDKHFLRKHGPEAYYGQARKE
ncbi:MAG: L-ribulose-5-phosphate 4-epimerase AraD [Bacteroidetes bacterium SB0662_bin_6]|nr:L-ribulose-5-phosphate 4-epimerase AraD [Bacteroidetes bacterium SB0668_bin_1]MYE03604.1 L-ribulose-5-phosphate 4-epimerase AraD [Bacteroidetes bacterium SB0662_bin_6]